MTEIACIAVPRFALVAACGERRVRTEPIALLAGQGAGARVLEGSRRAEAHGVQAGMSRAQALGRCPGLRIALPDPVAAEELWTRVMAQLEGLGAAVEPGRPGEAFFAPAGLGGLYGGIDGVLSQARRAMPLAVRAAAAPARFAAFVAAVIDRRRAPELPGRGERVLAPAASANFLGSLPITALAVGPGLREREGAELVERLRMLGVGTLGELAALGADQIADRFGRLGLAALRIARGEDGKLRPRERREELSEALELPEGGGAGTLLEHGLELVVERLLAQPQRKGRTIVAVRLNARLVSGGSWTTRQALGRPTGSSRTIASLLRPRLQELPEPPVSLALRATALGPPDADQLRLPETGVREGGDRLEEAIRQLRVLQGPYAVLDIVEVEPDSYVPERWATLVPWSSERHGVKARTER